MRLDDGSMGPLSTIYPDPTVPLSASRNGISRATTFCVGPP
jgi:hypothetical protein